jgi:DUF1680 family protein
MLEIAPPAAAITTSGELDARLSLALGRILSDPQFDDEFVLEDIVHKAGYNRQFEDWAGDISGRFIGCMALCRDKVPEALPRLHRMVETALTLQRPNGRIGTDQADTELDVKVAWGQGRILVGLLEYHEAFPSEDVLRAAVRLGDYFVRTTVHWRRLAAEPSRLIVLYTQSLEAIMLLHEATSDARYLATAREIAAMLPDDIGGTSGTITAEFAELGGHHSHGYMSTLIGLARYCATTADSESLERLRRICHQIGETMLLVDGTPPEIFPWSARDEGCSTADWLTLNLWMGRITGEAAWFEMAERVWRNALYGNQAHNGGFCHHHFGKRGFDGHGNEAWWCCAYHGPRCLALIKRHLVTWDDDGLAVQFVEPFTSDLDTAHGAVRLVQETAYPSDGKLSLWLEAGPSGGVPLRFRIPSWATARNVRLNTRAIDHEAHNGYLRLRSAMKPGDRLEFELDYGVRIVRHADGETSLWHGPLLLVQETTGGTVEGLVLPVPDDDGRVTLPRRNAPQLPFVVPGAHYRVTGLGNAKPGRLESLALNRPQSGWLRPLSEQILRESPSPATLHSPVTFADTPLLREELDRTLRG